MVICYKNGFCNFIAILLEDRFTIIDSVIDYLTMNQIKNPNPKIRISSNSNIILIYLLDMLTRKNRVNIYLYEKYLMLIFDKFHRRYRRQQNAFFVLFASRQIHHQF